MISHRRTLLLLFAVALGLRVLYTALLSTQPELTPMSVTSDLNYAREMATGFTWVTEPYSPRTPGYPALLGTFYLISGKQLWLMVFFQAILGALTVVLVYSIGRSFLGAALASIAALWFAFHVHHMHIATLFYRDILVVFLLTLLLYLLLRPFKKMRYAVFAGLVYGALVHVDPQFLLMIPVFVLLVLFKSRHGLLNIQYLFLFLGVLIVVSAPWTVRNYKVYGQLLPIGLEARKFLRPAKVVLTEPERGISDVEDKIIHASRSRLIQTNAVEFWRFARFHGETPATITAADTAMWKRPEPAWSLRHNLVSIVNYGILLPFFFLGLVFAVKDRNRTGLMLAVIVAAYFVMRSFLGGSERTRIPVDPLIILLAFYGLMALVRRYLPSKAPSED
ncbi:MAG: glycosyltransferase family 39 protein [Candidatus Latescibacterota bacterium]|nr:MAG: glycosyltransferase family 39 protein [Candidatus Latescibacterota bacterium]